MNQYPNNHSLDINKIKDLKIKIAIIVSNWNKNITEKLYQGSYKTLIKFGINKNQIKLWRVPGSYELIFAANRAAQYYNFDSIIVIGSLIEGDTYHFKYLCQSVSQGIKDIIIKYNVPVIFCVLTDKNEQQAINRSGGINGNKGIECAKTAIHMSLLNREKYDSNFT